MHQASTNVNLNPADENYCRDITRDGRVMNLQSTRSWKQKGSAS